MPDKGLDDMTIELLVNELASLDSNNFMSKCGMGERESRIACSLVKRRHFNLGHGIGRSGDLEESQPKASGSSLMNQITNCLTLDLVKTMGIHSAQKAILIPMATGMTLMLSLLTIKSQRKDAKYVLWSRIDQKSCFKCSLTANLIPIVIDTIKEGDELITNVIEFENQINELGGASSIVCILSTSSCFAPRACDNLEALAVISKKHNIPHIINNAYGLQSTYITHQIEQAHRVGNVDLFIQSTDKNLMVPVGGAIIVGQNIKLVNEVAKSYAGRASSSQTLDVFMTLLSLGKEGYKQLVQKRKENFIYLQQKLGNLASRHSEKVLLTKRNPISLALTLENFDENKLTMIGSMLFTRGVSGTRVVSTTELKTIDGYKFHGWGSHTSNTNNVPYLTAAASIGVKKDEIDTFIDKLDKILIKVRNNDNVAIAQN